MLRKRKTLKKKLVTKQKQKNRTVSNKISIIFKHILLNIKKNTLVKYKKKVNH